MGPYGILQFLADGVKMMTKEDVMPFSADKMLFYLAPVLALVGVFATLAVLPFSSGFAMADLNVGIFYLIAISSLVGLAVFLGGYASNSKWSMLGGMRGASQYFLFSLSGLIRNPVILIHPGTLHIQARFACPGEPSRPGPLPADPRKNKQDRCSSGDS